MNGLTTSHTASKLKHTGAFTLYVINASELMEVTCRDLDPFRTMWSNLAMISKNVRRDLRSREFNKKHEKK